MYVEDFHTYTQQDAIAEVTRVVSKIRMSGIAEEARFITGHGVLHGIVITELEKYGLEVEELWGNSGIIRTIIE